MDLIVSYKHYNDWYIGYFYNLIYEELKKINSINVEFMELSDLKKYYNLNDENG